MAVWDLSLIPSCGVAVSCRRRTTRPPAVALLARGLAVQPRPCTRRAAGPGTSGTWYYPQQGSVASETVQFCHICILPRVAGWSPEELRWADAQAHAKRQQQACSIFKFTAPAPAAPNPAPGPNPVPAPSTPSAATPAGAAFATATAAAAGTRHFPAAHAPAAAAAPVTDGSGGSAGSVSVELQAGSQISLQLAPGGSVALRLAAPAGQPLTLSIAASGAFGASGSPAPAQQQSSSGGWQPQAPQPQAVPPAAPAAPPPGGQGAAAAAGGLSSFPNCAASSAGAGAAGAGSEPAASQAAAAEAAPAEGCGGGEQAGGSPALSIHDSHWDKPDLPPDWHLRGRVLPVPPARLALGAAPPCDRKDRLARHCRAAPGMPPQPAYVRARLPRPACAVLEGGRLLRSIRLDEEAGEAVRLCAADSSVTLLAAAGVAGELLGPWAASAGCTVGLTAAVWPAMLGVCCPGRSHAAHQLFGTCCCVAPACRVCGQSRTWARVAPALPPAGPPVPHADPGNHREPVWPAAVEPGRGGAAAPPLAARGRRRACLCQHCCRGGSASSWQPRCCHRARRWSGRWDPGGGAAAF